MANHYEHADPDKERYDSTLESLVLVTMSTETKVDWVAKEIDRLKSLF